MASIDDVELEIRINADTGSGERGLRRISEQARRTRDSVESLGSELGRLAGIAVGALVGDALASGFMEANVEAGRLRATLQTVTGSVSAANGVWSELVKFASTTPYELAQSVQAFIDLKSRGLEPSIAALRSYGNTASAFGADLTDMIGAVADAAVGDFQALERFGLQASATGDKVAITFKGVTTTIANESEAIQAYLKGLGETDFASGMQLQSEQLGGALSNLGDNWSALMRAFGDAGGVTVAKAAIAGLSEALDFLRRQVQSADSWMSGNGWWAPSSEAAALNEMLARRNQLMGEYLVAQRKISALAQSAASDTEARRLLNYESAALRNTAQAIGDLDTRITALRATQMAANDAMQAAAPAAGTAAGGAGQASDAYVALSAKLASLVAAYSGKTSAIDALNRADALLTAAANKQIISESELVALHEQTGAALEAKRRQTEAATLADEKLAAEQARLDESGQAAWETFGAQIERVTALAQQYLGARAAAASYAQAQSDLAAAGSTLSLSAAEQARILSGLAISQAAAQARLAESYDTAWAAAERYKVTAWELDTLLGDGQMTAAEYGRELEIAQLKAAGATSALAAYFADVRDGYQGVRGLVAEVGDEIKDSLSDALAQGELDMDSLLTSLRGKLADFAVDQVWDQLGSALAKAVSGSSSSSGGWLSSLLGSVFGGLSGGASAPSGALMTFAGGTGYVHGPGTSTSDSVPAWLSVGEAVLTAAGNARHPGLAAHINAGGRVPGYASGSAFVGASPYSSAAGATASPIQITVENHGSPVEVEQVSASHYRLIARQEAAAAVRDQTPALVASEVARPNSRVSKALATHTSTTRRRT